MKERTVLACITAQPHCVEIIKAAQALARRLNNSSVTVVTAQPLRMDAHERAESVKILSEISRECGVDVVVRYGDNPAASIAAQAAECEPIHIFIGEDNGFVTRFRELYSFAPISMVSERIVCTIPADVVADYA